MDRNYLKTFVYSVFSDLLMLFLAFLILPVVAIQFFYQLTDFQRIVISAVDWFVWAVFLMEFVLKVYVEKGKFAYLKANRADSIISIIIIASPALELLSGIFSGAAALRLLRAARLARLSGYAWKLRSKWRTMNFQPFIILLIIAVTGFLLALFRVDIAYEGNDALWISTFVSITGFIYAVVSAFAIAHVWGKFNSLSDEVRKEASSLKNITIFSCWMRQKGAGREIRKRISKYVRSNIETFWENACPVTENADKFAELMESVGRLRLKGGKGNGTFGDMAEELRRVSDARSRVTSMMSSKTPGLVWVLLGFLSFLLIASFSLMDFQNTLLSFLVVAMTTVSVALVGLIVYDIDAPFQSGFWMVDPSAYFELEDFIKKPLHEKG